MHCCRRDLGRVEAGQCGGGPDLLEALQPAGLGPALLHPAREVQGAGDIHLLEGLEVALRRQVPQDSLFIDFKHKKSLFLHCNHLVRLLEN